MNITMRQLQIFEAVAHHLSYTRAAAELHLTQPAVSIQIRQLEDNLALPLFEQLGRRIYLTEAGQALLVHSRAISSQLRGIEDSFTRLRGLQGGILTLAVASTVGHFATRLLAAFAAAYPEVHLRLSVCNRNELLTRLEHNDVDLVMMGKPPAGRDLESEAFMRNPLVVIAPPDHPLLRTHERVPLQRLAQEQFVLREIGSGTRSAIERFFHHHNIDLHARLEMGNNESLKQTVTAGLGLGIVSLHTLELELETERLAVLHAEHFPIERQWYLCHREGKCLSPAAEAFRRFTFERASLLWSVERLLRHCEPEGEA